MGYREMVQRQVRAAFKAVGNLAINVQFTKKSSIDYDFDTDLPVTTNQASKTIKAILILKERKKDKSDNNLTNTITATLKFNAQDVDDPTVFDTVVIGSDTWRVIQPYESNGYTVTVSLAKEG